MNILPERFQHFYSAWDATISTDKTISKLMERLQQEEHRMKSPESQVSENALFSKSNKNKFKRNYHAQSKSNPDTTDSESLVVEVSATNVESMVMLRVNGMVSPVRST